VLAKPKRTHLNRALSKLGICSRTMADGWIAAGRVKVNGIVAMDPEFWVELGTDKIDIESNESLNKEKSDQTQSESPSPSPSKLDQAAFKSELASTQLTPIYLCMHKPAGYVTTRSDELGRKNVYDLLPPNLTGQSTWIFPVGRLDLESEGLLLLTNDGEWSNLLTDPAFHVEKTYRVKLDGRPLPADLEAFRKGILLDGRLTLPAQVEAEGGDWYRVVITEGRNRQIRKMFHALGYKVKRLVRVAIGSLELGALKAGEIRILESEWVQRLHAQAIKKAP
jgi:23S rRNA pseudouridine2605 synthase